MRANYSNNNNNNITVLMPMFMLIFVTMHEVNPVYLMIAKSAP